MSEYQAENSPCYYNQLYSENAALKNVIFKNVIVKNAIVICYAIVM